MKQRPIEEAVKIQKKESGSVESHKSELRKLIKLLKSHLEPVVEVFREEGKTNSQQPHLHEYKNGYIGNAHI